MLHRFHIRDGCLRLHLVHYTPCASESTKLVAFDLQVDGAAKIKSLRRAQIYLTRLLLPQILIIDVIHNSDNFQIGWRSGIISSTDPVSNRRLLTEVMSGEALADNYHLARIRCVTF